VAHLEGFSANGRRMFVLHDEPLTIGRAPEAGIHLEGDASISRLHAVLEPVGSGWTLRDLGSRNGSFVNDQRVTAPVALRPGDELRIGAWRMTFVDADADPESTRRDDETPHALPNAASFDLSNREREVLALLARGDTDEEIAGELFIAVATVRSHLDRIRDKTGCRRRPELTRLAVELGIVPPRRSER
jgi:DNA-binding CsgD family transcriptional regulator